MRTINQTQAVYLRLYGKLFGFGEATRSYSWMRGSGACLVPASSTAFLSQRPAPAETLRCGYWPCPAFQLCPVQKHRFVICFAHPYQLVDKLVEQLLRHILTASCVEPGKGTVIRRLAVLQQPVKVDPVRTSLLQFPAGLDPSQIPVDQSLNNTRGSAADFLPLEEYASYSFPYSSFSSWAFSRRTGAFSGIIISEFSTNTS